jgi:DNA-binding beta-propeller fold protein YncE
MPEFPRPQPAPQPLPPAAAISAYRDALLRDAPPEERERLAAPLDPELVAWLDIFRAAQRESMRPDPSFITRLDRVVAAAPDPASAAPALETLGPLRLSRSHAVNGRHAPPDSTVQRLNWPRLDPRLALGYLATAALLVLVVAAGLYAFGPLRPRLQRIMLGAPVASQLEFLWESNGGSDPRSAISSAYGVGVDPAGDIWVSDDKDRFHIVAPDGTFREIWGTPGSAEGEFDFHAANSSVARDYGDVAFDAEGNIYVADTSNSRIQKFAPDRTFLLAWGSEGEGNGQFLSPSSIAIGNDGVVYVGDDARGDIQKFDGDGQYLGTIGEYGMETGQLFNPSGVVVTGNGDVLVADYSNFRIQRFTSSGEFLDAWGQHGTEDGQFNQPNDVAVDEFGRVYVADDFNNRVQVFSPDGRFLAKAGTQGSDPGELDDPLGVAVGPDGTAYVSDRNGIQAFRLTD